jgi:hypothetical protein
MSDNRPTRDTLSRKEATISNMWEIAAIVELPEQNGLSSYMENGMRNALLIAILLVSSRGMGTTRVSYAWNLTTRKEQFSNGGFAVMVSWQASMSPVAGWIFSVSPCPDRSPLRRPTGTLTPQCASLAL